MAAIPAIPDGNTHDAIRKTTAAAQTFTRGAFIVLDGSGDASECGADPASIFGIALEPAGKDPEGAYTIVAKAYEGQFFWMSANATLVKATHEGQEYGVVKDADGTWVVDISETVNTRVYLDQVDESTQRCKVHVLAANRQIAA